MVRIFTCMKTIKIQPHVGKYTSPMDPMGNHLNPNLHVFVFNMFIFKGVCLRSCKFFQNRRFGHAILSDGGYRFIYVLGSKLS